MPENPFKEPENPRSTKGQATTWDAPVETRDALTPTDIVEPAWPYGHVVHELMKNKEKKTRVVLAAKRNGVTKPQTKQRILISRTQVVEGTISHIGIRMHRAKHPHREAHLQPGK